jgi:hypothetical protein
MTRGVQNGHFSSVSGKSMLAYVYGYAFFTFIFSLVHDPRKFETPFIGLLGLFFVFMHGLL